MTDSAQSSANDFVLILVTVPNDAVADRIAHTLVAEQLVACVNVVPGVRSIYAWEGEICNEGELQCLLKTRRELFSAVRERVLELHPYQIPEIIALPLVEGHPDYLAWLRGNTRAR
jgi:periplasmic divalent cation tolerance protein